MIASINEELVGLSDEPRSCSAAVGSGLAPILFCQFKIMSKSRVQSLVGRKKGRSTPWGPESLPEDRCLACGAGVRISLRKNVSGQFFVSVSGLTLHR